VGELSRYKALSKSVSVDLQVDSVGGAFWCLCNCTCGSRGGGSLQCESEGIARVWDVTQSVD
jgi:hypothetical protein